MKILSAQQIREADAYTIQHEPISSIDLMERASHACFTWITKKYSSENHIKVFCGIGNNGGDGLAIARLLKDNNYPVQVFIIRYSENYSDDCKTNLQRLTQLDNTCISTIESINQIPKLHSADIIIDALLGTGTNKPATGILAEVITTINNARAKVIAIDLPSGLYADESNQLSNTPVIIAHTTLTFQLPKLSMFFPENAAFVSNWEIIAIGLNESFLHNTESSNYIITTDLCKSFFKTRNKYDHKGKFGHALILAGSYGKIGASVLSSKATLRTGAGLLTTQIPQCGYSIIQSSIPEAMAETDINDKILTQIPDTSSYNAIAIGPGIGQAIDTQHALKTLIEQYTKPIIFDADAINILAQHKHWLEEIPKNSILTPHIREFERIAGKSENDFHRNELQRYLSSKYSIYIVLKGAHTAITCPDGTCYFNTTGNPGMATAGSGDVLTGIILGLLAQRYSPKEACLLGVYIHGKAGDLALQKQHQNSLIASDIIDNLGSAFTFIEVY